MDSEAWSKVSLRVGEDGLDADRLATTLGRPNVSRATGTWATDFGPSATPLESQLSEAAAFLSRHVPTLRDAAPTADVSLLIGWSPRRPQDGLNLSRDLIDALAAVRASVLLDTYED
jgi:hypothetical protein